MDSIEQLPKGVQPGITMEELVDSEHAVRNDPEVIRLCAEVGIKPEEIMCEFNNIGWAGHLNSLIFFLYQVIAGVSDTSTVLLQDFVFSKRSCMPVLAVRQFFHSRLCVPHH